MSTTKASFWPFEVPPVESRTVQHNKEVHFLETAYNLGFQPRKFDDSEYQAVNQNDHHGWIISRGGYKNGAPTKWEVWLDKPQGRYADCWVDDFNVAAELVIQWLIGEPMNELWIRYQQHVLRGPHVANA